VKYNLALNKIRDCLCRVLVWFAFLFDGSVVGRAFMKVSQNLLDHYVLGLLCTCSNIEGIFSGFH
jgi:hypothetical protein